MPATLSSTHHDEPPEAQREPGLFLSTTQLRRWWNTALDLLFPPRCIGCGRVDTHWCSDCQREIDQIAFPAIHMFENDTARIPVATTGTHDGKLQQAVVSLKYENEREIAGVLGQRLGQRLGETDWIIDMIVPVPLHTKRLRERGYNQSQLIGEHVARKRGIMMIPQAITRRVETRSQVGLNAQEREENMQNAFTADNLLVKDKTILLIDDVFTTGATLSACAQAALAAGARAVYGLTVTRA